LTGLGIASGLGALALVLALLVLAAALARRWVPASGAGGGPGRIEVLARTGLAPRQGVATVRVAGRTALVSYGDGGVRLLLELEREGAEATAQGGEGAEAAAEAPGRFEGILARAGRSGRGLRALLLGLALLALPQAARGSQDGTPARDTQHVAAPSTAPTTPAGAAALLAQGLPDIRVSVGSGSDADLELSGPVGTVLFVGFLTLLPTLLLLMTSFTRILVVLHLLKQALGTQTAPPAHLLTAMALILTAFVMSPTLEAANERALAPWMEGKMDTAQMLKEASVPFRSFMLHATREQDLAQFVGMSGKPAPADVSQIPLMTLTAAFVTSELTSAFQMGFALFLPFVVIDVVVASVLMSMGMFMLPPVMVSLPFKLLLFVLVDGWSLIVGSLVRSFA
jgi:flagellar biosynthetic protein FliP